MNNRYLINIAANCMNLLLQRIQIHKFKKEFVCPAMGPMPNLSAAFMNYKPLSMVPTHLSRQPL
jgi:hypothetical protein